MDVKQIEIELSKFIYELETENRLCRVGLKEKAQTSKIYKKYQNLFTREVLDGLKKQINKSGNAKTREILQRIYFTIAGCFIGLKTASLDDSIKTYFSEAKVRVKNEELAYFQIGPKIAKEPIFEKRESLDDVASPVVVKINPKQLALLHEEIALIKTLGFAGYLDYFAKNKKVDYSGFYKISQRIAKETDNVWQKTMSRVSREVLGRPFKNIRACHLGYLRSLAMFDNFYPKEKVVSTFLAFAKNLGLADLLSRVEIDDKDRPRKNPRAVCYWPKPPEEIHLVIKPIGGEQDFEAMFHEGGHALHGAAVDTKLPYALKTLSRSGALTETYAFILEDLVFNPLWLSTFLNVSANSAQRIQKQAYFVNLMMLRRYLGKFSYEYEMFSQNAIAKGPALYAKNLQNLTGFITKKIYWLSDMDSGFYSADYLRAWIGAAQIKDYLKRKFGQKWFLNPKAGKFLRGLFARGVSDEVEDVVRKLSYRPFDISLLVSGYKKVLS